MEVRALQAIMSESKDTHGEWRLAKANFPVPESILRSGAGLRSANPAQASFLAGLFAPDGPWAGRWVIL